MKRQPSVVSKISGLRANGVVALPITKGARLMLSTPPAMAIDISPAAMARDADGHRFHTGGAQPIHRHAGHRVRNAGKQQRHARDVAIVLARLVGAAQHHFVDGGEVALGKLGAQRGERVGGEIVRADRGERSGVAADGRPDALANVGSWHSSYIRF